MNETDAVQQSDTAELAKVAEHLSSDSSQDKAADHPEQATDKVVQPEETNEPIFTLEVDGEKREVKQSELLADAQKYLSASKRLEEAQALRQQVETERKQLPHERVQLQQAIQHYTSQLAAFMQQVQPNWEQLLQNDTAEYVRQRHMWDTHLAELQRAQQAQSQLEQQQQAEQAQQLQAWALEERQKLLDALPEWQDPKKKDAEIDALNAYLRDVGFSEQERYSIVDHRIILTARKAMLYDQLLKSQNAALQRVQRAAPRVERPGTPNTSAPADAARKAAEARFSQDPSVDNLAAFIH